MSSRLPSPFQGDFFRKPIFESLTPTPVLDAGRFRSRLKRAMSAALRDHETNRETVCAEMSRQLGQAVSKGMLDAYTAEAKPHDISLVRFKAFVRAVHAPWLWDVAVSEEGLVILRGDEPRLAEIARLQQEQKAIAAQLKALRSAPVDIKRGR